MKGDSQIYPFCFDNLLGEGWVRTWEGLEVGGGGLGQGLGRLECGWGRVVSGFGIRFASRVRLSVRVVLWVSIRV